MAYKNGPQTFNQSEQGGVSICLLIMLTVNLELTLPKRIDYKFAVPLSELSWRGGAGAIHAAVSEWGV